MAHALGFPLSNRVFATLVITAKDSETSFIDVQVPLDLSSVPTALYSTGKNRTEGVTAQQKKKVVMGSYVSVERCRIVDLDTTKPVEESPGLVHWDMATASDAKGGLPMAVQKLALPGVIAKDVGFVMDWAEKRRTSEKAEPRID